MTHEEYEEARQKMIEDIKNNNTAEIFMNEIAMPTARASEVKPIERK